MTEGPAHGEPHFPSAGLDPGERHVHEMAFRFRVAGNEGEAFPPT